MILSKEFSLNLNYYNDKEIKYSQQEIDDWLKQKNVDLFILKDKNVNLGFILYQKIDVNTYDLLYIYVIKNMRNKKIAEKLLKGSIELLKDENIIIFLEVSEKNLFAIKLYEKINFKRISIRKKYYKDDTNALIYKFEV